MGTTFNQYLFLGVKLPFKSTTLADPFEPFEDNGYEAEIVHHEGLVCISDGRDGKYRFLGRIIKKSECGQPLDEVLNLDRTVEAHMNPGVIELLVCVIRKTFPELGIEVPDIGVWLVTHWH